MRITTCAECCDVCGEKPQTYLEMDNHSYDYYAHNWYMCCSCALKLVSFIQENVPIKSKSGGGSSAPEPLDPLGDLQVGEAPGAASQGPS